MIQILNFKKKDKKLIIKQLIKIRIKNFLNKFNMMKIQKKSNKNQQIKQKSNNILFKIYKLKRKKKIMIGYNLFDDKHKMKKLNLKKKNQMNKMKTE